MKTADGKEYYGIELDLQKFEQDISKANRDFESIGSTAEREGNRIDNAFDKLGRKVAGAFAVGSLVEFERKIISVRGEMESLQISFETLAGKQVGRQLYNDIKQFAVTTPMLLGDLSKGAQTLLGFGIEAEKVMPILRQIGDISMGDAQRFNSLSLAFAQMSSTGKLMGQDLLQMINAGFNPLTVIAEKTGKSVADLKDEMSKGKISVEMVEDAFRSAASEGGKFYGMLEKQGKGVKGAIAQMEGAIENMLNGFGDQQQGVLVDGIHLVTEAINHYEELGKVILTVAAAYGSWKGAQMLVAAYQNTIAKQTAAVEAQRVASLQAIIDQQAAETAAENTDTAAVSANTAAKTGNTTATDAQIAAIGRALQAKLAEAQANLAAAETEAQLAANRLREAQASTAYYEQQYQAVLLLGDGEKIEAAENMLNTAASNENAAAKAAQAAQDNVATAAKAKEAAATRLSTFQTQVDTVQKQANAAATGVWAAVTRSATAALQGLKAAMASNPFGLALVAITSIVGLLSLFKDETEEATDALDKLRNAVMEDTSKLNTYRAVLDTVDKKSKQYTETMNKVNAIASEYHTTLLTENDTVEEQRRKYEELTAAIKANAAQKLLAEAASKADQDSMKAEKDAMDELIKAAEKASHTVIEYGTVDAGDGKVIPGYEAVEKASQNIRNITTATWNAISQEIMEHSRDFAAAADQGEEAYKKAVDNEVEYIKKLLKELGVTDKEMAEFEDNLRDYVQSSADGFQTAYRELGRSEAQLNGIAAAAVNVKDVTNDAIDQMNYEQLQDELDKVKKEIAEIESDPLRVETDDSRLKDLRDLLVQINNLIPKQLTEGSDAALEKRLKKLKDDRDGLVYGSDEWKAKNAEIATLSKTINSHKKSYAENADRTSRSGQSAAHKAAEERKKQQEYLDLQKELADERKRNEFDLWAQTEQAAIDAMRDGSKKTLRQIGLDFAQRKEELRRQYEDLRRQKFEEDKRLWEADPKHKNTPFEGKIEDSKYDPTTAETGKFEEIELSYTQQYVKLIKEVSEAEIKSLYDYLKEYGSIQSQKLAITKEYDEKIEKEQDQWKKKTLEKERQAALDNLTSENLLSQIDLGSVFSDYGKVLAAPLEETIKQLEKYTTTDAFKQRTIEEQKSIFEAIQNAKNQLGGLDGISFSEIGQSLYEYNNAIIAFNAASSEMEEAADDVIAAQRDLALAEERLAKATTEEEKAAAKRAVESANDKVNRAGVRYNAAEANYSNAQTKMVKSQQEASNALQKFQSSIDNVGKIASAVASGSMKQLWDALGSKTQLRIMEFVSGTRSINKAIGEITSALGKQDKGLDYLVERIKGVASEVYESGEKIESSNIGSKITNLFTELFGDESKDVTKFGKNIANVISKVLSKSKDDDESEDDAVKKAAKEVTKALAGSGGTLWTMIIGLVLDLLDVLRDGIGNLIDGLLVKVGDAVEGILSEIGSGRFFVNLAHGVANLVSGIVKGIANLFSGGYAFGGSNVDDMEKEIAKLSETNQQLAKSIDNLSAQIGKSDNTNQQSIDAYKKALEAEKEWEQNQRKSINNRASEWSNSGHGFFGLGGRHSYNANFNESHGSSWYGWGDFNRVLKDNGYSQSVSKAEDIWNLSPEMMQLLREYAPKAWAEVINYNDGESNPKELIDEYIDRAGKIDELTSALNEKLTGYSWDGFLNSYKDLLKDLKSETKDFGNAIEDIISNAMLESLVNEEFKEKVKALYQYIADHAGDGLDETELQYIRSENERIANEMISRRQALIDAGIIKEQSDAEATDQSATKKGYATASQDSIDELNGRFAGLMMIEEQSRGILETSATDIAAIREFQGQSISISQEIRNLAVLMVSHLEDISKYTKHLVQMDENVQYIKDKIN